jgi:DNA repair protein RadD
MAVDQIIEYSADRKAWMIFCVGKEHAYEVAREIKSRGISCETIISDTKNRDEIIDAFKDGKIRCLTCVDVLTTGFNAKNVDMIALLRPTLSTSLYVQMVGRGTRLCDGKKDCLVLDFGGNVRRHGPVDDINIATAGRSKEDEIKSHACPGCHSLVSIRKKVCPSCGFVIIPEAPKVVREASHSLRADVHVDIMGAPREIKWLAPTKITAKIHQKAGSPDSLKITYMVGFNLFDQYLPIAHPSAGHAARSWWAAVIGTNPPRSAQEALDRFLKEKRITAIVTERNGNFTNPCAWRVINQNGDVYEIDKTNKDYRKKKLFKAA